MGVNLITYRIPGTRDEEGWLIVNSTVRGEEFDSRGEKAFTREVDINWEYIDEAPEGYHGISHTYCRPKDIDTAIKQAIDFDRQDIADLFEKMRTQPDLWIFISS
jgi:hypothetical protein